MFFRSIKRHLEEQNWTAIWIDFLIVVVGVFMGVQVDRWYQDRKDLAAGEVYLQRIANDLATDVESINDRVDFWKGVSNYGDQAIRYFETEDLANDSSWQTLLAFYQASQLWRFGSTDTTYLEMRSSGNLDLIQNHALRNEIVNYYVSAARLAPELFRHSPEYRETIRGLIETDVQDYIWENCYRSENYDQWLLDCDAPISEEKSLEILKSIKKHPEILGQLRFWNRNLKVTADVVGSTKLKALKLIEKLN